MSNRHVYTILIAIALQLVVFSVHASDEPQHFRAGSLANILGTHRGQPFLLNVWSLTCPPCRGELDLLARARQEHPGLDVVLISTDAASQGREIQSLLRSKGLGNVESWVFAEANAQRLRYEIDAKWFGEMPRSYFYDAKHKRLAVSGVLTPMQIDTWAKAVKR
jgi:thiol-disulfide isomerase/thioredoxin